MGALGGRGQRSKGKPGYWTICCPLPQLPTPASDSNLWNPGCHKHQLKPPPLFNSMPVCVKRFQWFPFYRPYKRGSGYLELSSTESWSTIFFLVHVPLSFLAVSLIIPSTMDLWYYSMCLEGSGVSLTHNSGGMSWRVREGGVGTEYSVTSPPFSIHWS